MLFSIVLVDVLLCRSRPVNVVRNALGSLTYLEMLSNRDELSRFMEYLSRRSFRAKGR